MGKLFTTRVLFELAPDNLFQFGQPTWIKTNFSADDAIETKILENVKYKMLN